MKRAVIIVSVIVFFIGVSAFPQPTDSVEAPPLVIGYCQGEEYFEFDYALNYLIMALEEKGMIGPLKGRLSFDNPSKDTWELLQKADQSSWKVRFGKDAYFTLTDSDYINLSEGEAHDKILKTVKDDNIGLIIACGTVASLAVKGLSNYCGIISLAAANPLKSRIVNDVEVSHTENVWAVMDTDIFKRSVMVMNDILKPKTVGIVYANNEEAYIYSGADEVDKFAAANNIAVKKSFVDDPHSKSEEDMQTYYLQLTAAFKELSREVDVFIMTTSLIKTDKMKELFHPFYQEKVPIYSINSTEDVKSGALMAVEMADYENYARFAVNTIMRYMEGEKLSELPQVYQTAPFLVFNYSTAKRIGYMPDFKILLGASKIYTDE